MTRKLRWGILGVAQINNRLLPGFARAQNAELRAIGSRSLAKAQTAAKQASIPVAHGSYEALLADPSVDAVYIPLPNTMHEEWTRKAADHGKHILCEKPLCPSAGQAQAVVDFCQSKGVKLMDGFMWPHHPRTQRIRQLLDSGIIGEVRRVSGSFTFAMAPLDPQNIRLQSALAGGSLLDVGCYPVYGIRWAFGAEPVRVSAAAHYLHGVDVEMNAMMWLADGRVATFDCGFTHPLRQWLEITGSKGVLSIPEMWLPGRRATWTITPNEGIPEQQAVEGEDQIVYMLEDFGRAVLNGEPVRPAPEEAVKSLRVLDALAESARNARECNVAAS
jgi:D-xylose 1-dehydrogenase (NADP+, D-xylono-1,5-lactone-forming)